MGQPWQKTTSRVPGPSTVPNDSREWTRPRVASGSTPSGAESVLSGRATYIDSWKVRAMTSFCCSRVSELNLTA